MSAAIRWKTGYRSPIKAETAVKALHRLESRYQGRVSPSQIVDAARSKRSVLHSVFDWDDVTAAESWRREEARTMVNHLVYVDAETEKVAPAFVSVIVGNGDASRGYASVERVMAEPDLRAQAIEAAFLGLASWERRYAHLSEFVLVTDAIRETQQQIENREPTA